MPLLKQFLENNRGLFDDNVYAISAQGDNYENVDKLVHKVPSERIIVVGEEVRNDHDLTVDMANALTSPAAGLQTNAIHQFLHGYSDGYRLLAGSLKLPPDLARLMLRVSDLSGSGVVKGFDQYITGYPLDSINSYAVAMTWYAPEMPRPGCVWTHTLVIPSHILASIPSLGHLVYLFKRPTRDSIKGQYEEELWFNDFPLNAPAAKYDLDIRDTLATIFMGYYGWPGSGPVVLVARNSTEFTDAIFALWSQQWPSLRRSNR